MSVAPAHLLLTSSAQASLSACKIPLYSSHKLSCWIIRIKQMIIHSNLFRTQNKNPTQPTHPPKKFKGSEQSCLLCCWTNRDCEYCFVLSVSKNVYMELVVRLHFSTFTFCARSRPTNKRKWKQKHTSRVGDQLRSKHFVMCEEVAKKMKWHILCKSLFRTQAKLTGLLTESLLTLIYSFTLRASLNLPYLQTKTHQRKESLGDHFKTVVLSNLILEVLCKLDHLTYVSKTARHCHIIT